MTFEHVEEFQVTGMAARTSNAIELAGEGAIPQLWGQVMPPVDGPIIALYTEYESDEHGEYTFLLGVKSGSAREGVTVKTVPAGRYAVFTSARGPVRKVVPETWQRIWSEMPSEKNLRSYIADFEVYDERASDPANAVVDIYIGVK